MGIGHWALGIGHWALGISDKSAFVAAFIVSALSSLVPLEQARAQLYLDIFPSNDNTNHTLWVFSGSISSFFVHNNDSHFFRTSGVYARGDTTKTASALFQAGTTTTGSSGVLEALTPLSSTNTPNDLEYMTFWSTNANPITWGTTTTADDVAIPSTATNTPTLTVTTVASAGGSLIGSRTIANMYFRDVPGSNWDDIGPRVNTQLDYGNNANAARAFSWTGAGVLNKPISHFVIDTTRTNYIGTRPYVAPGILGGWAGPGNLRIRVHSAIPEPEEYALVFGLFALGFVLVRRHFQKKQQRQQAQTATTS